jgi:hypothetical protein
MRTTTFLLALALATAGCGKKPAPEGVRLPQVNDALLAAGFKLDAFKPIDPGRFAAQTCAAGPLDGIDALVCEYASPDAAALAKKDTEGWVGEAVTGAVLANGRTLLAVADRGRADPNGKTIHRITQAYQRTH